MNRLAEGVGDGENEFAVNERGHRVLKQIFLLREEVANVCDAEYVLSEMDLASIYEEGSHSDICSCVASVEDERERLLERGDALVRSEAMVTAPANAPRAPRGK